jgi:hypothetical protein
VEGTLGADSDTSAPFGVAISALSTAAPSYIRFTDVSSFAASHGMWSFAVSRDVSLSLAASGAARSLLAPRYMLTGMGTVAAARGYVTAHS